jgi:phosphopantothenoylcysteine synthetase/decarboxylase
VRDARVCSGAMNTANPSDKPCAIVTCGPGVAPVDSVRCLTNTSTGELGVLLSEHLAGAGWEVACWKSATALFRDPVGTGIGVYRFTTNSNLVEGLRAQAGTKRVLLFFHVAALCDYEVASIEAGEGTELTRFAKIPSDYPEVRLTLRRAAKVLPLLAGIYPGAQVIGWKLEFDGDRAGALEKGARQIRLNGTALAVVNGPAYGAGFGVLDSRGTCAHAASKTNLCEWLVQWAQGQAGN